MQQKVVFTVALLLALCLAVSAFRPSSRLFPMPEESEALLNSAQDLARSLGADIPNLHGEEEALPEERAQIADEWADVAMEPKHSLVETQVESSEKSEEPQAMVEQQSQEKEVQQEMERMDYRDFLSPKVASLIESAEEQLSAPAPELNFLEVENQISAKPLSKKIQLRKLDRSPYAKMDIDNGGTSQRHVSGSKGVDVYIVANYDDGLSNEVRPVAPPHPTIYPPYNRRIVPHSPPRPDENKVNPVNHLSTLSIYEASFEGPEFRTQFRLPPSSSPAAAFLALEANAPPAASAVTAGGFKDLQYDSDGNWIPRGSRPPRIAGMEPAAITTINSIPYGYRGNYENGFPTLEPNFPAKTPTQPAVDGPAVRLDELLPLKADIVEDLDVFHKPKPRRSVPNWD